MTVSDLSEQPCNTFDSINYQQDASKHRREMFFFVTILLIQPSKSQNIFLTNLKYQLKNKYPPLAKNVTKGYHSVITHALYHFCDMSLITACAIFCSLKFHVVCACSFFGDTICLLTNQKMIEIVTLIHLHIVLTYDCWQCFLSLQYLSESCFGVMPFTQPFSLRCQPPP
jgi:hypothetical protein